jgi:hypothetical protein
MNWMRHYRSKDLKTILILFWIATGFCLFMFLPLHKFIIIISLMIMSDSTECMYIDRKLFEAKIKKDP